MHQEAEPYCMNICINVVSCKQLKEPFIAGLTVLVSSTSSSFFPHASVLCAPFGTADAIWTLFCLQPY